MTEKVVRNLIELSDEAAAFVRSLTPRKDAATLITLSGELGAGKTAFTKAVAQTLGIEEIVTSPTFVLEKIYELPDDQPFKRLVHIDAYRLDSGKELAELGFDEIMQDPGALVFLEWPERVQECLPDATACITLETLADDARKITYHGQNA